MLPILEKAQKGLSQFVTSHLPVTLLILEVDSFNVNQGGKTSLRTGDIIPQTGGPRYSARWWNRRLFTFGLTCVLRMEWWLREPTGSGLLDITYQPGMWLFPLLRVIRAPSGVRALRAMTSSSPIPFTTFTEENIHAQGFLDP